MVRNHHDMTLVRHPGTTKIMKLLSRNYYFFDVYKFIKCYVTSCDLCSWAKPLWYRCIGELALILISDAS